MTLDARWWDTRSRAAAYATSHSPPLTARKKARTVMVGSPAIVALGSMRTAKLVTQQYFRVTSLITFARFCDLARNACKTLARHRRTSCSPDRGSGESAQNSLQAFYKRFSGPIRTFPSDRGGADAWQITTYGHGVLQTNPHGRALDQESPGSSPGGPTSTAAEPAPNR